MASHDEITARLVSRWPENRVAPSLGRIQALCDLLGNPERSAPVIQITGTNGKGSTAAMIDALLRSQGLRPGRVASPHLVDINERICLDGEPISNEVFDEMYEQIEPMVQIVDAQLIDGVPMTFFEVMIGLSFAVFADAPVDVMVLEVGLGGTWDATSVADAQVAVITPIDLDHTHLLGSTIAEIAADKAGIIQAGSTAVIAAQQPEAAQVLLARCAEVGALPVLEGPAFGVLERRRAVGGQLLRLQTAEGPVSDVHLPLHGEHMADNAALALAAVEALMGGKAMNPDVVIEGLGAVEVPARLELIRKSPAIVLDTAHNPHGVRAALAGAAEAYGFAPMIGVVAMMRDKAVDEVLALLAEVLDQVVVTKVASTDRGVAIDDLYDQAQGAFGSDRVEQAPTMDAAIERAATLADQAGPSAGVLVIGSVIAAGEARAILLPGKRDEQAEAANDALLRIGPTRADTGLDDAEENW